MWTITDYKMVYSRYESSGLSVEQFCWNERISRSRFYYWLRKYRKLTQKDVSIMNTAGDGFSRKHDPGFIPVLLSSGNESIYPLQCKRLRDTVLNQMPATDRYFLFLLCCIFQFTVISKKNRPGKKMRQFNPV